jgi:hypothetical protein
MGESQKSSTRSSSSLSRLLFATGSSSIKSLALQAGQSRLWKGVALTHASGSSSPQLLQEGVCARNLSRTHLISARGLFIAAFFAALIIILRFWSQVEHVWFRLGVPLSVS